MIPKVGEAILIGNMREWEQPGFSDDERTFTIGGDRSYSHDVWVCISVEPDRCVIMKLIPKGKISSTWGFGETSPPMVMFNDYPVNRCSSRTLEAMTGYTLSDDLLNIVNQQKTKEIIN